MNYKINHKHSLTFDELFTEYCEIMKHTMSSHTLKTKQSYYKTHFGHKYGHIIITDFKYKDAQLFVNELLDKGLQPKTVKNIVDIFKVLYKYAIMNEYCEKNPFRFVQLPKYDNRIYFNFTDEEIKRFISAIISFDNVLYRGIFIFLLHGRRLNEVLSLTWDMIDFHNKVYFIPPRINKAKKLMSYQMTDLLFSTLTNQFQRKQFECFNSNYVFPSPVTCSKLKDIRKQFKKLLKAAYIDKKMRIHDIRHLVASYAINSLGLSVEEVSYTLGHTSIEITQRYINPRAEISKKVAERIINSVL